MHRDRLPCILIPVAAFVAILPLLIHGCSCGHDFDFHLLNWMEAARQFTHGNLHPHWAYTPAWNAGEPRFVFYPPLSWTIGAILGLIFPWTWAPILYTWLALTAAGISLNYLTRDFTNSKAALIAAIFYTVNPYMLFTAYERTAYAELLAAAWIPFLLHAILRDKVTIPRIAIPIALLWLTNAPAAVMSCYALALLTLIRLTAKPGTKNLSNQTLGGPSFAVSSQRVGYSRHARTAVTETSRSTNTADQTPLQLALNTAAGTTLGLTLAAFYILPAAYERRYVQIAMAIIPFYRIQDNFLFHHTGDIDHDKVLHTASLIAILLIAATVVSVIILRRSKNARVSHPSTVLADGWEQQPSRGRFFIPLTILTITITLLLTPLTAFLWNHAPELAFLQFPWRLLAILAAVLAFTIALGIAPQKINPIPTTIVTIAIAAILTYPAYTLFHQTCDKEDTVEARLHLFHSNKGTDPTDEYTPTAADNDSLDHTNPPYWLSPDPNAKAPTSTQPGPAPSHLTLTSPSPQTLILNLRNYPAWRITIKGIPITDTRKPGEQRADGLIAFTIPSGPSTIDITYTQTADQTTGDIISAIALITLLLTLRRKTSAPS